MNQAVDSLKQGFIAAQKGGGRENQRIDKGGNPGVGTNEARGEGGRRQPQKQVLHPAAAVLLRFFLLLRHHQLGVRLHLRDDFFHVFLQAGGVLLVHRHHKGTGDEVQVGTAHPFQLGHRMLNFRRAMGAVQIVYFIFLAYHVTTPFQT